MSNYWKNFRGELRRGKSLGNAWGKPGWIAWWIALTGLVTFFVATGRL